MARLVHAVTAATVVAFALAGCGGSDSSESSESTSSSPASESAPPSTSAAAAADDEQQIRDLVQAQADAFSDGDWDTLAELTCSKFSEQANNPGEFLVPPITQFGTKEQAASIDPVQLSDSLGKEFGGASKETVDRVAQAIVAYDVPAYQAAMLDLMTESVTITVDSVENIQITGDTATADVTTTQVAGTDAPKTQTDPTPFVREDGVWLDCSDMAATS
ncbi:hypothetical protein [Mycolicibacterium parafortuitum]|uniref:Lipoprotein n=1 Tax=Mycolicibacterium parafortuitum TaxID=39692 RepID=A0A375YQH7_MYCPF|nr:hypothetical protein [Mycolicibacterium parafortuitum]ORB29399.1 hypothetical protein BST38_15625 [Mycolicibacterium parafortuitum]SRX83372.1 hypothetical protein MPP7335_05151 [Mycolicibacterium parafortuitum]